MKTSIGIGINELPIALASQFGGSQTILEQILASDLTIEMFLPGVNPAWQVQGGSDAAVVDGHLVDQVGGLKGAGTLYSDTDSGRPRLGVSSGVAWWEGFGDDFLTTDPHGSLGTASMTAIDGRHVRVSAWRLVTPVQNTTLISNYASSGGLRHSLGVVSAGGVNLNMFGGNFSILGAHPGAGVDFVVAEDWDGATSRLFINGVLVDSGDPYTPQVPGDANALTLFALRSQTTLNSFVSARCYGIGVLSDWDDDLVSLISGIVTPA